ncbi:Helix-hairpin-helix motif-containing protein [Paramicrobacterium humi]|uniref:Helix-hairpin-helix motif-containing protein n=1 Tax=Paramicrobacterium humi TaxID=640635 RepID=A0A1H4KM97_9MICO|nr:helix-hairpin-helix domain-containing protein [Microbacterium humi]SEB59597.1 Helix-hairpin-helix motif-containing protein [Microbacterium humi]
MADDDKPSIGWMLARSSWLLLTLIPGPLATWFGFAVIATVARRGRWFGFAAFFAAAAIVAHLPLWGRWGDLAATLVFLAGIVAGLAVNPTWLRLLWTRRSGSNASRSRSTTWHRAPTATSSTRTTTIPGGTMTVTESRTTTTRSTSRSKRAEARAKAAAKQAEQQRAAEKRKAQDAAREQQLSDARRLLDEVGGSGADLYEAPVAASGAASAEPVDVNTAPVSALQKLPGMSRRTAKRAVKVREDKGGFASLDDFAASVGLQPHEIVRLRTAATCSPPPRGPRTFGRRVDY